MATGAGTATWIALLALLLARLAPTSAAAACGPSCGQAGARFPTPGDCVVSGVEINPKAKGCCADPQALALLGRLLDVLGGQAYEKTKQTVDAGNSPFGAAILANSPGYPLVHVGANTVNTAKTPTAHGEVSTINSFFQTIPDAKRPKAEDTIFLATHQPCPMCMSAIGWGGFRRVFYGFDFLNSPNNAASAKDTKASIMDAAQLEQLFGSTCGRVDHTNGIFNSIPIQAVLQLPSCGNATAEAQLDKERARFKAIFQKYRELGQRFQVTEAEALVPAAPPPLLPPLLLLLPPLLPPPLLPLLLLPPLLLPPLLPLLLLPPLLLPPLLLPLLLALALALLLPLLAEPSLLEQQLLPAAAAASIPPCPLFSRLRAPLPSRLC